MHDEELNALLKLLKTQSPEMYDALTNHISSPGHWSDGENPIDFYGDSALNVFSRGYDPNLIVDSALQGPNMFDDNDQNRILFQLGQVEGELVNPNEFPSDGINPETAPIDNYPPDDDFYDDDLFRKYHPAFHSAITFNSMLGANQPDSLPSDIEINSLLNLLKTYAPGIYSDITYTDADGTPLQILEDIPNMAYALTKGYDPGIMEEERNYIKDATFNGITEDFAQHADSEYRLPENNPFVVQGITPSYNKAFSSPYPWSVNQFPSDVINYFNTPNFADEFTKAYNSAKVFEQSSGNDLLKLFYKNKA